MKLKDAGTRGASGGRRPPPGNIGQIRGEIRMEWMDPMSWRLPSGKALAEFALQAGFLAPLMLVGPRYKKPKKAGSQDASGRATPGMVERTEKQVTEVPGRSGSFRDDRQTGVWETQ
jgi:hypothetical protein